MNTPKFLIADPCYILDKETWQSLCDEATDLADEKFEGNWEKAFGDALARHLFYNATPEESDGLTYRHFLTGIAPSPMEGTETITQKREEETAEE